MKKPLRKESLVIFGILFFILIVCFYDVFFLGKTFKVGTANAQAVHTGVYGQEDNKPPFIPTNGTDAPVLEEPLYEFIKRNLRKGILPLWNPHQACGYPLIGMIQVGMFFPLNFILYIFPQLYAWDILIIVRFLLAGLFTYWLMRSLKFKEIPALGSAVAFMLSGPMVLLQYWTANVDILAPLLLICIDRLIRRPILQNIALTAILAGLTFFAGHPEHIFLVNVYGFLFFCFRTFSLRKIVPWKKSFGFLMLAYLLGLCLAAMVLFPFLKNLLTEFWHGHPDRVGLFNEEVRERLLTLAVPHFFQKAPLTYEFTFAGWWGGYLGAIPLGLTFLSLFNKHKRGLNYFFAGLAFLIISKAYGFWFINWIGYLPLFDLVRYAIHTPHLAALSIAICTGMGIRSVLLNKKIFQKGLFYSVPLLAIIAGHLLFYKSSDHFSLSLTASLVALGVLIVFQAVLFLREKNILKMRIIKIALICILSAELFLYIHRERPNRYHTFPEVPYIEFLKNTPEPTRAYGIFWVYYPNTATGYGTDDLGIFIGMLPKRFVEYVHHLINPKIFKNDLRPPALRAFPLTSGTPFIDILNVEYLITPSHEVMGKILTQYKEKNASREAPVYSGEVNVYKRREALPRAYIVHKFAYQPDKLKAFKILRNMQPHLRDFVVINHTANPYTLSLLAKTPLRDDSTAKITKYTPNEVVIEAEFKSPGFLVLSDAYHPDWKVYINGNPGEIYQTNYLVRSVFLGPGEHKVRFIFRPWSFYGGLILSLFSLLVTVVLLNWTRIKTKFE